MKIRIKGFTFHETLHRCPGDLKVVECALKVNNPELTALMVQEGWVKPFDVEVDPNDPKSVERARLQGVHFET